MAYIDKKGVDLRNKRNMCMNPKAPELADIYKRVKEKCILDRELLVYKDVAANAVAGTLDSTAGLSLINAVVVALAANGAFDAVTSGKTE